MKPITIHISDILDTLNRLTEKTLSREEASDQAYILMEANDNHRLEYTPVEYEEIIWDAITFLLGIDLLSTPGQYLYGEEDIQFYLDDLREKINTH